MMVIQPKEVDAPSLAFGGRTEDLLPPWSDLPESHRNMSNSSWGIRFVSDMWGAGLKDVQFAPADPEWGQEDVEKAFRHIRAVLASWGPKHEHKIGGMGWLVEQWFTAIRWKTPRDEEWKSTPDVEWPDQQSDEEE